MVPNACGAGAVVAACALRCVRVYVTTRCWTISPQHSVLPTRQRLSHSEGMGFHEMSVLPLYQDSLDHTTV